jgi:hypothetical protein
MYGASPGRCEQLGQGAWGAGGTGGEPAPVRARLLSRRHAVCVCVCVCVCNRRLSALDAATSTHGFASTQAGGGFGGYSLGVGGMGGMGGMGGGGPSTGYASVGTGTDGPGGGGGGGPGYLLVPGQNPENPYMLYQLPTAEGTVDMVVGASPRPRGLRVWGVCGVCVRGESTAAGPRRNRIRPGSCQFALGTPEGGPGSYVLRFGANAPCSHPPPQHPVPPPHEPTNPPTRLTHLLPRLVRCRSRHPVHAQHQHGDVGGRSRAGARGSRGGCGCGPRGGAGGGHPAHHHLAAPGGWGGGPRRWFAVTAATPATDECVL